MTWVSFRRRETTVDIIENWEIWALQLIWENQPSDLRKDLKSPQTHALTWSLLAVSLGQNLSPLFCTSP